MGSAMIHEQLLCGLDAQQPFIAGFRFPSQTILRADAADKGVTLDQVGREILAPGDRVASRNEHEDLLSDVTKTKTNEAKSAWMECKYSLLRRSCVLALTLIRRKMP